jgi:hypothetical protein
MEYPFWKTGDFYGYPGKEMLYSLQDMQPCLADKA